MSNTRRQHGVTIGGRRYVTDEHGKFLPKPEEPTPEPAPDDGNGSDTPPELEWLDDPPLVPRPEPEPQEDA